MKKIYISYDVIGEEIIDAFVRKNDEAAKRDFIRAFQMQSKDSTHVQLFNAFPTGSETSDVNLEGIPCIMIWDSKDFEKNEEEASEN